MGALGNAPAEPLRHGHILAENQVVIENVPQIVLIAITSYLPGHRAGGPIRTVVNLVDQLGDEVTFKIVTKDRDSGDIAAYPRVKVDEWNRVGKAQVYYASPASQSFRGWRRLLESTPYDTLHLNGAFAPGFTIKPLILHRLGLIPRRPVVVSPKGQFSPDALKLKRLKKRLYLYMAKRLGLYRRIRWHAVNQTEAEDIRREFGADADISVVRNLVAASAAGKGPARTPPKETGKLNVVFLSRISKMKNLDGALKMLHGLKGEVHFNIYGPAEDMAYWSHCQRVILTLPETITVKYCGEVSPGEVDEVFSEHDLFLFPTFGESFGHVIYESLAAGCPVLISDRTPWRELQVKCAGWDAPLEDMERFKSVLQQCVDMGPEQHSALRDGARSHAAQFQADSSALAANRILYGETYSLS